MRIWPAIFLLLAACGSNSGSGMHWSSIYRQDIHSVAVPIFDNRDYHRGVEFDLSSDLVKEIEEITPYKVMPRERADTVIEGEIVTVKTIPLDLDPNTATPQESQYVIVVNFTWKNLHTGKILLQRRNFEQATPYYPTLGEGMSIASENATQKLARGIVTEMEADW